jgi:hypothetical protein
MINGPPRKKEKRNRDKITSDFEVEAQRLVT